MKHKVYICSDEKEIVISENENVFQSKLMFSFYKSLNNYHPFFICIEKENLQKGYWLGVIIQEKKYLPSFISSRCLFIGEPYLLCENMAEKKEFFTLLVEESNKYLRNKCLFTEIRGFADENIYSEVFREKKYDYYPWHNVLNKLDTSNIRSSKIRQITSAQKKGICIREVENISEIEGFYAILKPLYRNIKKPLPQFAFFTHFFEMFCKTNNGVILSVFYKNKIIGGILCVFSGKQTIHEWYVGSLHQKYKELYPGVMSTYAGLVYGKKQGFENFDFMGAGAQNSTYGVRNFKLTFGGELQDVCRWQKINFPILHKIALMTNKLL